MNLVKLKTIPTMKHRILFLITLLMSISIYATAQFSLRPQIGYNSSVITKNFNDLTFGTEAGFQFGIDAQIGRDFYIQPGIIWESANNELRESLNTNTISMQVNRIRIPVMLGYKLLGSETSGLIDFRAYTGPNVSFVVDKDLDNTSLISKNDFKNAVYGWNAGIGLDLALLFVDAGYSFGLSEIFESMASSARNNIFYANVGVRIGF